MARLPSFGGPALLFAGGPDPFLTLHREMNRLFDDVLRTGSGGGEQPSSHGGGGGAHGSGALLAPHIDVSETASELRIRAELPGVSESDIDLSLNEDVLTIRAEKHQERRDEREGVHLSERSFGTFQRSLRLPFSVDEERIRAEFQNGVLTVALPKVQQQERVKKIQVRSGGEGSGGSGGAQTIDHAPGAGAHTSIQNQPGP